MINGATQLLGLIGWPVSHSFSPAMHNAAIADLALNFVYVPLPVPPDEIATAVQGLPALGFRGVNVTVPHKQAVIPLLDEIGAGAQAIGAVNTIVIETGDWRLEIGSRLVGYNTDWSGFLTDLERFGVTVSGRDCLILGAGGSARAIAYALASVKGRVQVLARRIEQAQALVADLEPHFTTGRLRARPLTDLPAVAQDIMAPLIVNATPIGMTPKTKTSPWPDNCPFPAGAFVYDLVYNPTETRLMRQAQAAGCQAANGLGMLVQQGVLAFELWTGRQPDGTAMMAAIQTVIGK
jgi:shikimate dehydrogenase